MHSAAAASPGHNETTAKLRELAAVIRFNLNANSEIAQELALPPVKIHCSILAEDAIKAAVSDYKQKHGQVAVAA